MSRQDFEIKNMSANRHSDMRRGVAWCAYYSKGDVGEGERSLGGDVRHPVELIVSINPARNQSSRGKIKILQMLLEILGLTNLTSRGQDVRCKPRTYSAVGFSFQHPRQVLSTTDVTLILGSGSIIIPTTINVYLEKRYLKCCDLRLRTSNTVHIAIDRRSTISVKRTYESMLKPIYIFTHLWPQQFGTEM